MNAIETKLKGCFVIEPTLYKDDRGYFFESFNQKNFNELIGQSVAFVQDNQSYSKKNVIRGLHAQEGRFAQSKLVRVTKGCVWDIAVDIRENSPTFGEHMARELSEDNQKQLFIPKGFLHGFSVLSDEAVFNYKCDHYYQQSAEIGVHCFSKELHIDWRVPINEAILSEKDAQLPDFEEVFRSLKTNR